jgi:formyltetrahydrofolate deformylase
VDCDDRAGLIYDISKIIYENGLNIERNSEFVDRENSRFFFRALLSGEVKIEAIKKSLTDLLPKDANISLIKKMRKDIVLMATREAHCLGDILIRVDSGEMDANILAVISNHDNLRELSERFSIPYYHIPAEGLSREEHEKRVMSVMEELNPSLIVLAKYMRILTPLFVERYEGKIINIHHSFLPAFIGANPYKQAFERGVKIIGATAHYVNNDLDEGPIIAQDVVHINHEYGWRDMQKAGRDVEKIVLSKALELALKDRIFVYKNKTVIF